MKNFIKGIVGVALLAVTATSCDLKKEPYTAISDETFLHDESKWPVITAGNYYFLKDEYFTRNYYMMGEYPGDNVALSGGTSDALYYSYTYQHLKNQGNANQIWRKGYQAINGANKIIEVMPEGRDAATDQLIGENLFIRAFVHFSLCRIFARPYNQGADNPGVPVMLKPDVNAMPARNTVKEVYDAVIADLLKAKDLMTEDKECSYATKEAAEALLSRVYLYKEDNQLAKDYADSVLLSNKYSLTSTASFPGYYAANQASTSETIFCIRHTIQDDRDWSSIGSMYYTSPSGLGYGEMYASLDYVDLIEKYPNDVRNKFIVVPDPLKSKVDPSKDSVDATGRIVRVNRNGVPKYFILKFANQDNIPTLSSPIVLRLAEMYLNRAEANAKLGNTDDAIEDVNTIRQRAGLSGAALYTVDDLKGHASVLDVVLEERRLELAFEAHRPYDLFRNKKDMVRNYVGQQEKVLPPDQLPQVVKYTDDRIVHYIPEQDILLNNNLEQNP
ncbi:RagB/SusD family nutrient uptake outer membrane protein [Chitinophaga caeni]|uniref:RagB/SusD family nutrient uptake outer membrane protein n=1 Tax=Chitinophaga caeni TaxID=2029983 RepID=A0A291QS45_9BACT|nr:RagB/SusD family nutrient uptake outer membrane protein [Chitinophaga caeni]ATL46731.1 RagB/SusD family nutrient uptake outer membrane protein [Chitinophaga caeni]